MHPVCESFVTSSFKLLLPWISHHVGLYFQLCGREKLLPWVDFVIMFYHNHKKTNQYIVQAITRLCSIFLVFSFSHCPLIASYEPVLIKYILIVTITVRTQWVFLYSQLQSYDSFLSLLNVPEKNKYNGIYIHFSLIIQNIVSNST